MFVRPFVYSLNFCYCYCCCFCIYFSAVFNWGLYGRTIYTRGNWLVFNNSSYRVALHTEIKLFWVLACCRVLINEGLYVLTINRTVTTYSATVHTTVPYLHKNWEIEKSRIAGNITKPPSICCQFKLPKEIP